MHLMFTLSPEGKRIYTLKKEVAGAVTTSAHPARFSPDDKFSRQRVTLKKRCVLFAAGTSSLWDGGGRGGGGGACARVGRLRLRGARGGRRAHLRGTH